MTLRAVVRRRIAVGILVAMPVAFYFVTNDSVGQSVRALSFGLSWAVSTVAFFAAAAGREVEPRLVLAGWRWRQLITGRITGLGALGAGLTLLFGLLVAVDQDVRSIAGVVLGFAVTSAVAVGLGTAVGMLVRRELEGTLVLFFLAGLQAIANPFDTYSRALPFWSSRELATHAVDGPDVGSLVDGLIHAVVVVAICLVVIVVGSRRSSNRDRRYVTAMRSRT